MRTISTRLFGNAVDAARLVDTVVGKGSHHPEVAGIKFREQSPLRHEISSATLALTQVAENGCAEGAEGFSLPIRTVKARHKCRIRAVKSGLPYLATGRGQS
jgi:hypothetical protein